ncbi:MAG: S-methylmethionine-dependent homocysteine/selenocysteine methylase [Paracoccaceae bacterium]|jgi:S-methylmethionine-dependent homocysteine/selenocysteine methylase
MTQITLLDGGMGQEISKRAGDTDSRLWSTRSMIDRPGIVSEVHAEYFAAGATVATTISYPVHRDRLVKEGLEDQFEALLKTSTHAAEVARSSHGSGRIAGSIGPLGASYRPDLCPPIEVAAPLFAEVAAILAPDVDLLICETVASIAHAEAAMKGCAGLGLPVWLAVTVADDDGRKLRSGEALSELQRVIEAYKPDAILVNCSVPEVMEKSLEMVKAFGLPFGAYANGFTKISDAFLQDSPTVNSLSARDDLGPAEYADFALQWVGMGATIVGGCCETGPAHIAEIARRLDRSGFEIV